MSEKTAQTQQDALQAWTYATTCLLHEAAPGPEHVDFGSGTETVRMPRTEAVQRVFAQNMLRHCDADLERLQAAGRFCARTAADFQQSCPGYAHQQSRAADLCRRAVRMVIEDGGTVPPR